ncbi:MAG TPA: 2-dehydropantoate 2-reductase [Candidatus Dormibacteraeota bacterium]|nr:2-dehydropantoate 2-reductase [Candidatus Dormibacteraeota bacterium]
MTVAIVGAGAIGGLLGANLARSGEDVTLIARGAHLAAMRSRGLTVRGPGGEFTVRPRCSDDMGAIAGAAVVFITLKAHGIPGAAPALGAALSKHAAVVGAMNGIPWWYFRDRHLETVDPGGIINRSIPYEQVVGCVVYPAATLVEPGVIEHEEGNRFSLGEPDGSKSQRVQAIAGMLAAAGFKAQVQANLRAEIWLKLLGNATLNPASALTGATLAGMLATEDGRGLVRRLMEEVAAVARSVEVEIPVSIERRIQGAAAVGEHKTSMLQDLEAGKPLEIDALLGAVIELASQTGVEVPRLRTVYDLVRMQSAARRRD